LNVIFFFCWCHFDIIFIVVLKCNFSNMLDYFFSGLCCVLFSCCHTFSVIDNAQAIRMITGIILLGKLSH
jgi:hypothetical protein